LPERVEIGTVRVPGILPVAAKPLPFAGVADDALLRYGVQAVAVMAWDDEVIPLLERIENVADEADVEDVHNTERYLLYVACTWARDHLLVTGVDPASEFLLDLC
jgi:ATP-dependent exoDNAse (exonuclease V) beta subunit